MQLTAEQLTELQQALYNVDLELSEHFRPDYSGRAMYGKECVGFTGNSGDLVKFVAGLTDKFGLDEVMDNWASPRSDNMGYDTIWYWPDIQLDDEAKAQFAAEQDEWADLRR